MLPTRQRKGQRHRDIPSVGLLARLITFGELLAAKPELFELLREKKFVDLGRFVR